MWILLEILSILILFGKTIMDKDPSTFTLFVIMMLMFNIFLYGKND